VFGASIFLIAQMYHLRGEPYVAFGVWTLGALALAYATFSSPTMLLVCVTSLVWAVGWISTHPHDFSWYPIALCIVCIPFLACRCCLTFTGLLFAAGAVVLTAADRDSAEEWSVFLGLFAIGALYRGLGLCLEGMGDPTRRMSLPALRIGGLVVSLTAYSLSWHIEPEHNSVIENLWVAEGWLWVVLLGIVYIAAAASWFAALKRPSGEGARRVKHLTMLVAALLVTAGIAVGHNILLSVTANLALLAIAGGLLWEAVVAGQRQEFWLGLGLLVLVIVSRFLEWDTHLMVKSAVFILCGIGVTLGGVRFEKHLKGERAV
jgi:uncharacterized membrane protein